MKIKNIFQNMSLYQLFISISAVVLGKGFLQFSSLLAKVQSNASDSKKNSSCRRQDVQNIEFWR